MKNIRRMVTHFDARIFNGKLKTVFNKKIKYRNKAYQLTDQNFFPPHSEANENIRMGPCGELLAVGGDLSTERIVQAFKCGIYPMFFDNQPILWWTSETRTVLKLEKIHVSKDVKTLIKKDCLMLTVDRSFNEVLKNCATVRREKSWLTPERISSFKKMFDQGYCHSIEVWKDGHLGGGLFGTAIGSYFYVESSFAIEKNFSKYAAVALAVRMQEKNYSYFDCGFWPNNFLIGLGAEIIDRDKFLKLLNTNIEKPENISDWPNLFEDWDFKASLNLTKDQNIDTKQKNSFLSEKTIQC